MKPRFSVRLARPLPGAGAWGGAVGRAVAALAFALLASLLSTPAQAYCQTHTCEFDGTEPCSFDPVTGCSKGGAVTHWKSGCVSYAVQTEGSTKLGISASDLHDVVASGFQIWSDVDCSGSAPGTPELTATFRGETGCDQVEYNCSAGEDNANVVMFRDGNSELPASTIALSTIMANLKTGEILDVDVELNSDRFDFYLTDATAKPNAHDLRLVLNHELGHFLGLSHSLVPGALMRAAYDGVNRFPAPDDVAGMCHALNVGPNDPMCSAPLIVDGGACVGSGGSCPVSIVQAGAAGGGGCAFELPAESAAGSIFAVSAALSACGLRRLRRRR